MKIRHIDCSDKIKWASIKLSDDVSHERKSVDDLHHALESHSNGKTKPNRAEIKLIDQIIFGFYFSLSVSLSFHSLSQI